MYMGALSVGTPTCQKMAPDHTMIVMPPCGC